MNMQSCRVASFKVPTPEEAAHDFLWRIHRETPRLGQSVMFNRSHYEDVIVVRVHGQIDKNECQDRYHHINGFERELTDANTIVVKFFLHISKAEQERRLLAREQEENKAWKLSVGDWKERELWGDYTKAFEDAINHCSTKCAPWYLVPADHKWYRNLAVVQTLVETLKPYRKEWLEHLKEIGKEIEKELRAYRARASRKPRGG
jgi:PPK2 family polyphosphate:nucleotide phosphotransferase